MGHDEEIQVNFEVETSAIDDLHQIIMTGSYREIIDAWAKYRERVERILKHCSRLDSHLLDFHEIKNKEKHILISTSTGFQIVDISMDESTDYQ